MCFLNILAIRALSGDNLTTCLRLSGFNCTPWGSFAFLAYLSLGKALVADLFQNFEFSIFHGCPKSVPRRILLLIVNTESKKLSAKEA
jgi:hypothetical protein